MAQADPSILSILVQTRRPERYIVPAGDILALALGKTGETARALGLYHELKATHPEIAEHLRQEMGNMSID